MWLAVAFRVRGRRSHHSSLRSCGSFQSCDLLRCQAAKFAGMHIQLERAIANPLNFLNVVSDLLEHMPDLAIASFDQCDFVPGIICFADHTNFGGSRFHPPTGFGWDEKALTEPGEFFLRRCSSYFYKISLWDMRSRLHQAMSKIAVISEEEETLTRVIEAPHGVHPRARAAKQIHNG